MLNNPNAVNELNHMLGIKSPEVLTGEAKTKAEYNDYMQSQAGKHLVGLMRRSNASKRAKRRNRRGHLR